MKDNNKYQGYKSLGLIMSAGMTMAASVLIGYFLGSWLDERFGTKPWLTLVMFLLGAAAGLKSLYNLAFPKKEGDQ
jgi:ATP synthase protein I